MKIQLSQCRIREGPSGLHIFDRISGLNILLDESQIPRERWSLAPRQVSIALTNACDLKCSFCYVKKGNVSLNFEKIKAWIRELDDNGCHGIGFGGGEPTLYKYFEELCLYITRNTGLAVTITTHGHNLDDLALDRIARSAHFLRVSMDGVGKVYESIRQRSFDSLYEILQRIGSRMSFGINYVVNAETFPYLDKAIDIAEDVGASEFLLLPEIPVYGIGGIDVNTKQLFQNWVKKYNGQVALVISEAGSDGILTCNPLPEETGIRSFAYIDSFGKLKRNSLEREGIYINENGVMEAIKRISRISEGV